MIKHAKPKTFYDTFERKGAGEKTTHYCPGCGHGTMHKLIAEAIDDMGLADKVKVMVGGAPVTRAWMEEIGADGYSEDAIGAIAVAKELMGKS